MKDKNTSQKKVLLTGGTAGIGRATALLLVREGYDVVVVGRNADKMEDVFADNRKGNPRGILEGILLDLADEKSLYQMFTSFLETHGCPDILINNAALAYNSVLSNADFSLDYLLRTNLWAYMELARLTAQEMIKQGVEGDIVHIGSMSADVREKDSSAYVATKAGIQGFTESFRKEVNPHNIRVSLIEPGSVGSDMQPTTPEEERERQQRYEMLKAEDIADAVHFILQQPRRTNIVNIQIKPLRQFI
ncbi:SDR family oxidoreductase [Sphingobacterium suaedae]|uniref:SDR family oxidoreductase n=1 Tax=Sphingobacterium suaedae TaxID=1686402 RepID=A0ABW5KMH1_9SPHI